MSSFQELDGRFYICIQLAYPENWKQHHTTSSNISKRNIKKDVGYMSLTAYFIPIGSCKGIMYDIPTCKMEN